VTTILIIVVFEKDVWEEKPPQVVRPDSGCRDPKPPFRNAPCEAVRYDFNHRDLVSERLPHDPLACPSGWGCSPVFSSFICFVRLAIPSNVRWSVTSLASLS
jgi:hypothetical protein